MIMLCNKFLVLRASATKSEQPNGRHVRVVVVVVQDPPTTDPSPADMPPPHRLTPPLGITLSRDVAFTLMKRTCC